MVYHVSYLQYIIPLFYYSDAKSQICITDIPAFHASLVEADKAYTAMIFAGLTTTYLSRAEAAKKRPSVSVCHVYVSCPY